MSTEAVIEMSGNSLESITGVPGYHTANQTTVTQSLVEADMGICATDIYT